MQSDERTEKQTWGLMTILVLMMVIIPGLGALGMIAWWVNRQSIAEEQIAQIHLEIQSRGLPIDDASMTQFRKDAMDQSRSRRWMEVLDVVRSDTFVRSCSGVAVVSATGNDDREGENELAIGVAFVDQASVDIFLEQWQELLGSIHEITEGSGPIWTEIQFDGFDTLLPYVDATRRVAQLLNLEFDNAVRNNDKELAMRCLLAGIGNARSLEREPIFVSQLVSLANLHVTLKQMKFALEQNLLSPSQLTTLLEHLRPVDDFGPGFYAAIAGERAMMQSTFDNLENNPGGRMGRVLMGNPVDEWTSLRIMAELESVSTETLDDFQRQMKVARNNVERWTQRDHWLAKVDTTMSSLMTPSMAGFNNGYLRSAMEVRLVKVAIGCRLHHHQSDQWPANLETLGDQLAEALPGIDLGPIRPFGPRPFGHRVEEDGTLTLWSFPVQTHDQTPDEPIEATADQSVSQRNEINYLRWSLKPS